jgi:hypothetical protein
MATLQVSLATGAPTNLDVELARGGQSQIVFFTLDFGVFVDDPGSTAQGVSSQRDRDLSAAARRNRRTGSPTVSHLALLWPVLFPSGFILSPTSFLIPAMGFNRAILRKTISYVFGTTLTAYGVNRPRKRQASALTPIDEARPLSLTA